MVVFHMLCPRWDLQNFEKVLGAVVFVDVVDCVLWLEVVDQHGLGSKSTRAILLCSWERHFTAHSTVWWSGKQF